jgi:hypothetical protein
MAHLHFQAAQKIIRSRVILRNLLFLVLLGLILQSPYFRAGLAHVISTVPSLPCNRQLVDLQVECFTRAECQPENTTIIAEVRTSKTCPGYSLVHKAYMTTLDLDVGIKDFTTTGLKDPPYSLLRRFDGKAYCTGGVAEFQVDRPCPGQTATAECDVPPDFFGNCPEGTYSNGCGACCSEYARDACYGSGGYFNSVGGDCRSPYDMCFDQQYECVM